MVRFIQFSWSFLVFFIVVVFPWYSASTFTATGTKWRSLPSVQHKCKASRICLSAIPSLRQEKFRWVTFEGLRQIIPRESLLAESADQVYSRNQSGKLQSNEIWNFGSFFPRFFPRIRHVPCSDLEREGLYPRLYFVYFLLYSDQIRSRFKFYTNRNLWYRFCEKLKPNSKRCGAVLCYSAILEFQKRKGIAGKATILLSSGMYRRLLLSFRWFLLEAVTGRTFLS